MLSGGHGYPLRRVTPSGCAKTGFDSQIAMTQAAPALIVPIRFRFDIYREQFGYRFSCLFDIASSNDPTT
jgi:hypothetical protein